MRDTFHATGSGSKAMRGVPRVEELTRATKRIKTPEMSIYFKDNIKNDKNITNLVASQIRDTKIKDIISSYKMIFDSDTNGETGYTTRDKVRMPPFFATFKDESKQFEEIIQEWPNLKIEAFQNRRSWVRATPSK